MSSSGPTPVPHIQGTSAYRVPQSLAPIDLKLDGNEGATPPAVLFDELAQHGPAILQRYPKQTELRQQLATRLGLSAEQLLVTAGGDDALDRIARVMLAPGREMILPWPSFEMIARYARLAQGTTVKVPWALGQGYPLEAVLKEIRPETALVAVVSPNNPSGAVITEEGLRSLSKAAPQALILVDLAYVEFADQDLSQVVLDLPNAVAVRTLSKAWGLAGLRVGYAISNETVIGWLRAAGAPYSVSGPSLALASHQLRSGEAALQVFVDQVKVERRELVAQLRSLGAEAFKSQGNFVLARFQDAAWVREALAGLGIAVRIFPNQPELKNCLRITCPGNAAQFRRLSRGLSAAMAPQAIIFDLDGVLADVSKSYRRAVLDTAAHFGVSLSRSDVAAAKALGNANNDWQLTHRLLAQHGVERDFESVKEHFEMLYQGTEGQRGLRHTETLTVDPSWVAQLADSMPLAIVTGRPRKDAERFLTEFGVIDHFMVLICMEDAPSKPDPAPVERALKELGVSRAWMLGDTPDDLVAARGAGVVPLGIRAPGEQATVVETLLRAGAARVFESLKEFEDMLP